MKFVFVIICVHLKDLWECLVPDERRTKPASASIEPADVYPSDTRRGLKSSRCQQSIGVQHFGEFKGVKKVTASRDLRLPAGNWNGPDRLDLA
ncbi:hypothetical protein GWI33_012489, partial [Rhynchophorus ferrugineus]